MMNARKVIALLIAVLSALAFTISAAGKPSDNIIIGNADTVRETPVSVEQGLLNSIAGAGARVVVEYANTLRHIELPVLSSALQTRLDQVSARVVVEYANTVRHSNLVTMPTTLQTLLGQVSDRIIFQYANTNRSLSLAYPAALINDTTPPQISDIQARTENDDTAAITWTTDEFANSQVSYGTQSGQYTQTASDPLYVKQYAITMTTLTRGTTYYYQVRSADRSDNTATSSENSFKFQTIFDALEIQKSVAPTGQVRYSDQLTYTIVISSAQSASLGLYDPLSGTTFLRFVQRPTGVISTSHAVTGTLTVTASQPVTIAFVVRVDVPEQSGVTVDVTNEACVYVLPGTVGVCKPSNQVTNQAVRPTVLDALQVTKSVTPTGQVQYGSQLTYTLVISSAQSATLGLYDPLTDTTFVRFVQRPTGVVSNSHAITGTLTVASALPVTVTFVVRVDVPAATGQTIDVTNQACVYVLPNTSTCKPSNQVTNQAFRPYRVFLPVVLKNP